MSSNSLLTALLFTLLTMLGGCNTPTDVVSGTVEAVSTMVAAELGGRVEEILVVEGQHVAQGDLLVRLDCTQPTLQLQHAEAQLRIAEAQLSRIRAGAREAELAGVQAQAEIAAQRLAMARHGATPEQRTQLEAALQALDARRALAERTRERTAYLVERGSAAGVELERIDAELDVLTAERVGLEASVDEARRGARSEERAILRERLNQANARLELLRSGASVEEIAVVEAERERARVAVTIAEEEVTRCEVRAPVPGTIDLLIYEVGEVVPLGRPVVTLRHDGPLRFETFAPQAWLSSLEVGDRLRLYVDGYDDPVSATVRHIGELPSFTAGNVQTPDDRVLLVYPLSLVIEEPTTFPLRPGMTGVVSRAAYE